MDKKVMTENYFYNQYRFSNDGKTVIGKLSSGVEFTISKIDFHKVLRHRWYQTGKGKSNIACINKNAEYLHRYLMNEPKGLEVDHKDMNRMNNCRENLRVCTHQQNQCNQPLQSNNTSGVTGVRFYAARNKYVARIKYFGKDIHLGYYVEKIKAIQARDEGAKLLFGEFAVLNDVPEAPSNIKKYVYEKCKDHLIDEKKIAI